MIILSKISRICYTHLYFPKNDTFYLFCSYRVVVYSTYLKLIVPNHCYCNFSGVLKTNKFLKLMLIIVVFPKAKGNSRTLFLRLLYSGSKENWNGSEENCFIQRVLKCT